MRRAWVVLLVGCGFQSQGPSLEPDARPGIDAADGDASGDDATPSTVCWTLDSTIPNVHLSACPPALAEHIDISSDITIDTSSGMSTPSGITCAAISDGPEEICAISAKRITIRAGMTLSAHGERPLALLAHDIDLQGTIDVASHFGRASGPGATPVGCNPVRGATKSGGGGGGGFNRGGGAGGDQGGESGTGAARSGSITVSSLRGGCGGTGGGDGSDDGGSPGPGGGAGGAVWIAVDTGKLTIGNTAVINASGAGGAGGMDNHGGDGGGSGGLIVLQAPMIDRPTTTSLIFANGGGGGGGAKEGDAGQPGADPRSDVGGAGGAGGSLSEAGDGGNGEPSSGRDGGTGDNSGDGSGGGGGGGSVGLIWVASPTQLGNTNIEPDPIQLRP